MSEAINATIREVLGRYAKLQTPASEIPDEGDLYQAGLTSHASVNVMLALEDAFGAEFTDDLLRKATFQSVASIRDALERIGVTSPAA